MLVKKRPATCQTLVHTLAWLAFSLAIVAAQEKKPASGTFWSSTMQMPPLPYLPFDDLPLTETGPGMFLYDDSKVDYAALRTEGSKQAAQNASLQSEGEGGGGAMMCMSGTNTLYLRGPVWTNSILSFTIEGGEAEGIYDLYWHHSLGSTNPWVHLGRTAPGETNFALLPGAGAANFFTLGTQLDSDGDTLPDAYEQLVLRTDAAVADTMATLAAAGADTNLLNDAPMEIRTSQVNWHWRRIDHWSPCPDTLTDDRFFDHDWKIGVGGTNIVTMIRGVCVDNEPATNAIGTRLIWDANEAATQSSFLGSEGWSTPEPVTNPPPKTPLVKFAWHLESFPGGDLRTFDSAGEFKRELLTGGPRLSTQTWPWLITGGATELQYGAQDPFLLTTNLVPPTSISLLGTNLDATGAAVVLLRDNTTNNFTPVISGPITNYQYTANAQKVIVTLNFHGAGTLTPREHTNSAGKVVGYQADLYDELTNAVRTIFLGATNPPATNYYFNFMDITANVPTNQQFNGQWMFRRDVSDIVWLWKPSDGTNIPVVLGKNFSSGTAGQGWGNDTVGGIDDRVPDDERLILNADAPGCPSCGAYSTNTAPQGSIYVHRFYAREWLTWNGVRISPIVRWRSFLTIRRKADLTWERVGQHLIDLTPLGSNEVPSFTTNELQSIISP